jgi:hypothetical protein
MSAGAVDGAVVRRHRVRARARRSSGATGISEPVTVTPSAQISPPTTCRTVKVRAGTPTVPDAGESYYSKT